MQIRLQVISITIVIASLLTHQQIAISASGNLPLQQGITEANKGGLDKALKLFNIALQQNPNSADAYLERGKLKARLEQYQEAIVDFDRAIELNPSGQDFHWERANAKLRFKQKDAISALNYKFSALVDYQQAQKLAEKKGNFKEAKGLKEQVHYIENHLKGIAALLIFATLIVAITIFWVNMTIRHHRKSKVNSISKL
jgi:tetratricopeptide (TPR) repeat protein